MTRMALSMGLAAAVAAVVGLAPDRASACCGDVQEAQVLGFDANATRALVEETRFNLCTPDEVERVQVVVELRTGRRTAPRPGMLFPRRARQADAARIGARPRMEYSQLDAWIAEGTRRVLLIEHRRYAGEPFRFASMEMRGTLRRV